MISSARECVVWGRSYRTSGSLHWMDLCTEYEGCKREENCGGSRRPGGWRLIKVSVSSVSSCEQTSRRMANTQLSMTCTRGCVACGAVGEEERRGGAAARRRARHVQGHSVEELDVVANVALVAVVARVL